MRRLFAGSRELVRIVYRDPERKTVGFNWLGALGALVAVSVVIAIGVIANRRDM